MMESLKTGLIATITRGVMWALAGAAAYTHASPEQNQTFAAAVANFIAPVGLSILASMWSRWSASKLLNTEPPAKV